jgi:hypothetical protein
MGGTSVVRRSTLLSQPHELYILTLDSLSAWLADKLTAKQMQVEQTSGQADQFLFKGFTINGLNVSDKIHDPVQCKACYDDDTKPWCDCSDGLTVGALGAAGLKPTTLTTSWKKKLMHNMQDIGDFLMCGVGSIDNNATVTANGQTTNVAQYLVDQVFIPGWNRELTAGTDAANSERKAWANVIHTILVGQGCFMDLASTEH